MVSEHLLPQPSASLQPAGGGACGLGGGAGRDLAAADLALHVVSGADGLGLLCGVPLPLFLG